MAIKVEAMPDRVVLRFPEAVTDIRGIAIPNAWALRREVGEVVALGIATDRANRIAKRTIERMTGNTWWQQFREKHLPTLNRLTGWTRPNCKFLVSMAIGTYYWRKELDTFGGEFNFLRDLRVYNMTDLATAISGVAPEITQPVVMVEETDSVADIVVPQIDVEKIFRKR